jgi:hypothetical protein
VKRQREVNRALGLVPDQDLTPEERLADIDKLVALNEDDFGAGRLTQRQYLDNADIIDKRREGLGLPPLQRKTRTTGFILPEEPGTINVGDDEASDIRAQVPALQPPFYSGLERAVEGIKQDRAGVGQWRNTLKNLQGVKKDEMDWLGLDEWLSGQKGTLDKSAILDFIKANNVQIKEVMKGIQKGRAIPQSAIDNIRSWLVQKYGEADEQAEIGEEGLRAAQQGDANAVEALESLGVPARLMVPIYYALGDEEGGGGPMQHARYIELEQKGARGEALTPSEMTLMDWLEAHPEASDLEFLTREYDLWLQDNGLPQQSADELAAELDQENADVARGGNTPDPKVVAQVQWLHDFSRRWEMADARGTPEAEALPGGATQYGSYTLPGGENYRELLLTLPHEPSPAARAVTEFVERMKAKYHNQGQWRQKISAAEEAERKRLEDNLRQEPGTPPFHSSHFNEPNILAHIRFNDRTVPYKKGERFSMGVDPKTGNSLWGHYETDGVHKVLFIEEIQSDWHQQGRKQGYGVEKTTETWFQVYDQNGHVLATLPSRQRAQDFVESWRGRTMPGDRAPAEPSRWTIKEEPVEVKKTGVPNAPFKTTWQEVAFKRALRFAAENGYDSVAWTTGEQQANRYSLSRQLRSVNVEKLSRGKYHVTMAGPRGEAAGGGEPTAEQLPGWVGEDFAKKIIAEFDDKPIGHFHIYSGLDLTVGGEGMRGFYDRILPQFANKYGKKWGAQVGETIIPKGPGKDYGYPVHTLPITPQMRESVMQGQPLFQRGTAEAPRGWGHTGEGGEVARPSPGGRLHGTRLEVMGPEEQAIVDDVAKILARILPPEAGVIPVRKLTLGGAGIHGVMFRQGSERLISWAMEDVLGGRRAPEAVAWTARHESLHWLRAMGFLSPQEWSTLEEASAKGGWQRDFQIQGRYVGQPTDTQVEESIVEQYGRWAQDPKPSRNVPLAVHKIFLKLRRLLREVAAAMRKRFGVKATANDIFLAIEKGRIKQRGANPEWARKAAAQRAQTAYHGSPHDFDKFSTEAIGTGEGAQVYGHGLYFAGNKAVAEYYRDELAKRRPANLNLLWDGKVTPAADISSTLMAELKNRHNPDWSPAQITEISETLIHLARAHGTTDFHYDTLLALGWVMDDYPKSLLKAAADFLENRLAVPPRTEGKLYHVNLKPKDDEYLNWDKPLGEQSDKVKAALETLRKQLETSDTLEGYEEQKNADFDEWTASELVRQIIPRMAVDDVIPAEPGTPLNAALEDGNAKKATSLYLKSLGIPGTRYADQGSRNVAQRMAAAKAAIPQVKANIEVIKRNIEAVLSGAMGPTNKAAGVVQEEWHLKFYEDRLAQLEADARGEQTHNYVIFSDEDVDIEAKYQVPALPTGPVKFDDPESERRWSAARRGAGAGNSIISQTAEWLSYVKAGMTRHWVNLPNLPKFADLQQQLHKLEAAPEAANEEIIRALKRIIGNMTPEDLDLFTRKVVLDDLAYETDQEHQLPFGLGALDVPRELAKVDAALAGRPEIAARVAARKAFTDQIKDALVSSGVLDENRVKNPAYYRHQVLEYANLMRLGSNQKLRTPKWATRMGSSKDINANYLEAEFDWLRKALGNIAEAKTIEWIKTSRHNIRGNVTESARRYNQDRIDAALAADVRANGSIVNGKPTSPLTKEWAKFRQRIAVGLDNVRKAIDDGSLVAPPQFEDAADAIWNGLRDDSVLPFLSWILDNNQPGSIGAATAFKAIAGRRQWVKDLLGKNYADPTDIKGLVKRGLAPEGYTTWQPDEGKMLFLAKTIPERATENFLTSLASKTPEQAARELGLPPSATAGEMGKLLAQELVTASQDILAVGGERYTMIIPQELADTLNSLRNTPENGIFNAVVRVPLRAWKQWVLLNPDRVLNYNLNNLSGDLDAIIAGNPRVIRQLPQATRELRDVMVRGKDPSQEYRDAVERGVFNASITVQEIPDVNTLSEFEHLMGKDRRGLGKITAPIGKAWRFLRKYTTFRENMLRYAAYLNYLKRLNAGESMENIGYGASLKAMVDAVPDNKDKAALLARDLVGDYGAISHFGQGIRRSVIPFWSWTEINTRRYWRLTNNAFGQGIGKGLATSGYLGAALGARTTAWLLIRMFALYGLVSLWNRLMFGDDEDKLDPEQARQLHILLGHDSTGEIRSLRVQGAVSDALSWLGFEDAVGALGNMAAGRGSFKDVALAVATAPVKKLIGGVTPVISVPVELLSGQSYFPDAFNPIPIRDKWREAFRLFSLDPIYDRVMGKPTRGAAHDLAGALVYQRDPGEIAYDQVRGLTFDWLEREKGQGGRTVSTTPRSTALRDWRTAARYGDERAGKAAFDRMVKLGVTKQSMIRSAEAAAPLGSIAKKDRQQFLGTLTAKERERLDLATAWYNNTFIKGLTEAAAKLPQGADDEQ